MASIDEMNSMIMISSILYCHEICAEFKCPVEIMYPELKNDYLSLIKYPMDLGTILINCLNNKMTIEGFRRALQLVFVNALEFNKGTIVIESLAIHLYKFASELFENSFRKPFNIISENQNNLSLDSDSIINRCELISNVKDVPLTINEIQFFLDSLKKVKTIVPDKLVNIVKQIKSLAMTSLKNGKQQLTLKKLLNPIMLASREQDGLSWQSHNLSILPSLFAVLYDKEKFRGKEHIQYLSDDKKNNLVFAFDQKNLTRNSEQWFRENNVYEDSNNTSYAAMLNIQLDSKLRNSFLNYIEDLDTCINTLAIIIKERETRGIAISSIWAHCYSLLWAQPNKVNFPCMLLGGPNVPSYISKANWERIPPHIMKDLIKCKPKANAAPALTSEWKESNITSDYYLVEYFGHHEFGWVKTENAIHISNDEFIVPPKANQSGADTIQEARDAHNTINDIKNNVAIISTMPTIAELEKSVKTTSEGVIKVFDKIQNIPKSVFIDFYNTLKNFNSLEAITSKGSKKGEKGKIQKNTTNLLQEKGADKVESKKSEKEEGAAMVIDQSPKSVKVKVEEKSSRSPPQESTPQELEEILVVPSDLFKESKIHLNPSLSKKKKCYIKASYYAKWLNTLRPLKIELNTGSSDNKKRKLVTIENDIDGNKSKKPKEEEKKKNPIELKPVEENKKPEVQPKLYSIPMSDKEALADNRNRQKVMAFPVPVGSSTKHYSGNGVVHTKIINPKNRIFHYEHENREKRKEILKKELIRIRNALNHLQSNSLKRHDIAEITIKSPPSSSSSSSSSSLKVTSDIKNISNQQQSFQQKPQPIPVKVGLIQKMEHMRKMQALAALNQHHQNS